MTLSEENRKILINTRLDQAIETIQEVLLLIKNMKVFIAEIERFITTEP